MEIYKSEIMVETAATVEIQIYGNCLPVLSVPTWMEAFTDTRGPRGSYVGADAASRGKCPQNGS